MNKPPPPRHWDTAPAKAQPHSNILHAPPSSQWQLNLRRPSTYAQVGSACLGVFTAALLQANGPTHQERWACVVQTQRRSFIQAAAAPAKLWKHGVLPRRCVRGDGPPLTSWMPAGRHAPPRRPRKRPSSTLITTAVASRSQTPRQTPLPTQAAPRDSGRTRRPSRAGVLEVAVAGLRCAAIAGAASQAPTQLDQGFETAAAIALQASGQQNQRTRSQAVESQTERAVEVAYATP